MKTLSLFLLSLSFSATAQTLMLKDYKYPVPDIAQKKMSKEILFKEMNRRLVRIKDSICSNRAHVWSFEMKKKEVEAPKMFMFFTPSTSHFDGVSWWYHVTPTVNENGKLWVMDAGYPRKFSGPVSQEEWMKSFNKGSVCKEITANDHELILRIFSGSAFPETTQYGTHKCYYTMTPPGYWTPVQVAMHLSGIDQSGRPVNFNRDEFDKEDLMEACIEASTSPIGWTWGSTLGKCRYFINN